VKKSGKEGAARQIASGFVEQKIFAFESQMHVGKFKHKYG